MVPQVQAPPEKSLSFPGRLIIIRPSLMNYNVLSLCAALSLTSSFSAQFKDQTIDDKIGIGYGLAIADVNGDKKKDILLVDAGEVAWYENPGWQKHVITGKLTEKDHVCIAAEDIDGDGKAEIAIGAQWNPVDTVNSGALFFLSRCSAGSHPEMEVHPASTRAHRSSYVVGF